MVFDVIVIGSGVAGLTTAFGLSKGGKKVAVIESTFFGGVVYNVGSTRKKELVTIAQHALQNQRFEAHGITTPVELDWQDTMNWIDSIEGDEDNQHQLALKEAGITTIFGTATFVSPNEVKVDGIVYSAEQFVIASGGADRPFTFEGINYLSDSAAFLTQKELPKTALFIGAGIISFAFTTIAAAFGCNVIVLQHDSQALKNFDQEFVSQLIEINKKRAVSFHFNESVKKIEKTEKGLLRVQTESGEVFEVDQVYNVAGRVPLIDSLKLENAQVLYDAHGIDTNEYLQTNQSHIFACGDCSNAKVPKLATFAAYQADYLVSYLLKKELASIHYPMASMSIFSEPRIAQVGVSTEQALAKPEEYAVEEMDISKWMDAKRKSENTALLKIVTRRSDDRVAGAAVMSQEADIFINYITMALHAEWTKDDLKKQIYAYPSLVNDMTRFWK